MAERESFFSKRFGDYPWKRLLETFSLTYRIYNKKTAEKQR